MDDNSRVIQEKDSHGSLFLSSLAISNFATGPLGVLITLLLIDIALTFEVSLGVMGQISTLSSVVSVIFALVMGILSVRFRHKSLLIIGLLCVGVSALGCFLASNFSLMVISYSLSGVGTAMVFPMAFTLVGEHLLVERRGSAVGWIIAAGSLSFLIGAPVISRISDVGGWRLPLLVFVIPISLASLFLALIGVPSTSRKQLTINKASYLGSFKGVLLNISAAACLAGNVLRTASFIAIVLYGISFFRQRFLASTDFASVIIIGAALCYTLGSLVAGRIINKFGRKRLTVLTAFLAGMFIISFVYLPNLWLSLTLNFLGTWFSGMASSAANSLALEQTPRFRGTMMSINSAALSFGSALGSALGGLALVLFNYEVMGSILGVMGIVAAIIFHFLTTDQSPLELET
ncbi:MAG: MFS transporter [Candidatus Hodarchaeota archaeon]